MTTHETDPQRLNPKVPVEPSESVDFGRIGNPKVGRPRKLTSEAKEALPPQQHNIASNQQSEVIDHGRIGNPKIAKPINPVIVAANNNPPAKEEETPESCIERLVQRQEIWFPSKLRSPFIYFGALLLGSLLGIWLLSSVMNLAVSLALFPAWLAYPCLGILLILLAIVLYILGRALVRYLQVPYRPQLVLNQIKQNRVVQYRAYSEARRQLEDYLREIKSEGDKYMHELRRMGLSEAQSKSFQQDMKELLRDRPIEGKRWLHEYQDNIQTVLDDLADKQMRRYATAVGLKTAISPWKFVDVIAVFYNNIMLTKDLCILSNRRVKGFELLSVFAHVGFNMFIAAEAQEVARRAVSQAVDGGYQQLAGDFYGDAGAELEDVLADTADGASGVAVDATHTLHGLAGSGVRSATKFIGAKMAEGIANGWLTKRFGIRVWRLLTPLAD